MNNELKIQKEKTKQIEITNLKEITLAAMKNPVFEIVVGFGIIEFLQRPDWQGRRYIPEIAGTLAEGGIVMAVGLQQAAPLMPYLSQNISDLVKVIPEMTKAGGSLIPLLGTVL